MRSVRRHPKVILFLGAGASAFAGCRTFATFPDLLFNNQLREEEELRPLPRSALSLLYQIRDSLAARRLPTTHDNFLLTLYRYRHFTRDVSGDAVLRERLTHGDVRGGPIGPFAYEVDAAIDDISETTLLHYSRNRVASEREKQNSPIHAQMRGVHQFLQRLARRNDPQALHLPVFTTNYDMLMEDIFAEFSSDAPSTFTLTNGLPTTMREGCLWKQKRYIASAGHQNGPHLYRLHGCVCWHYADFGSARVKFYRNGCAKRPRNHVCMLIPGPEVDYKRDPHAFGFGAFQELLLSCRAVVFIGFSFHDDDVVHMLLSTNARRTRPLRLIVVDPRLRPNDVRARLIAAATRTSLSGALPDEDSIVTLDERFGASRSFDLIIGAVERALR